MNNFGNTKSVYPPFGGTVSISRLKRLESGSQRIQRGLLRFSAGAYTRIPKSVLSSKANGVQVVDISRTNLRKVGGTSASGNTSGFAYTATTSSLTWYWDGSNSSHVPVITRADASRFTVPTGGSPLAVTGLAANTKYYFLPFWNVNNLCNIGWVQGTAGSPQIAFVAADVTDLVNSPVYVMTQTLQGNEALSSGYMSASTTAAGSASGGAGGGGAGGAGCVRAGTDIRTVGDLPYTLDVISNSEWVHLRIEDGRELYSTYDHPLFHAIRGRLRADELVVGDLVITDKGEQRIVTAEFKVKSCSKHRVRMESGHLYWANGFLSHNKNGVSLP